MMCRKPFVRGMSAYGCGQCMPCRINRRRVWTHRLMLEALVQPSASFVTLTYAPEFLPEGGTLVPGDMQGFLKRLRFHADSPLRFYGVGEYGDFSWRPHYHLALFGLRANDKRLVDLAWSQRCSGGERISMGRTHVGELTLHSAQYIAGYVTKKMTREDDERLHGRYPEFARMSLRPGIGAPAIGDVASALQNKHGWDEIDRTGDVPGMLRHGRKSMPLGRYMRRRLRLSMNFAEIGQSDEAAYKASAEMLVMYKDYLLTAEVPLGIKDMIINGGRQRMDNLESRTKVFNSRKGSGI